MKISEHDWELFQERLPKWQEDFMDRLNQEYIELLSSDEPASVRFWKLEKRLQEDIRRPGVRIPRIGRFSVDFRLADLLYDGAITVDDLDGFDEALIAKALHLVNS